MTAIYIYNYHVIKLLALNAKDIKLTRCITNII